MDCPQAISSCGEMMERCTSSLFEDPVLGEEDNEDEVFSAILKDEDDNVEYTILPPIQSHLPSAQDVSSPSPVQTDMDLLEVCRRQCWGKLLLKVMRYNIALLSRKSN